MTPIEKYLIFLHFASQRLKLSFEIVEFIVQGFLRKYNLRPRTIECYLLRMKEHKSHSEIGKILKVGSSTVTRELQQLEFVCPELFVQKPLVPAIPWMYHPTKEEWEELEKMGAIKEQF